MLLLKQKNNLNLNISAFIVGGPTLFVCRGGGSSCCAFMKEWRQVCHWAMHHLNSGEDSNIEVIICEISVCHCMVFSSAYLQDNWMSQNHWNYLVLQNRIRNRPHSVKFNSVYFAEKKDAEAAWCVLADIVWWADIFHVYRPNKQYNKVYACVLYQKAH